MSSWAISGYFLAIQSDSKILPDGNVVVDDPKEFDDPLVSDSLEVKSKEYADFYHPKKFDDPQVFDDPKEISIGSMDFDNPKLYGDTSIFNGLVLIACKHL